MKRPTRVALQGLGLLLTLVGFAGALGVMNSAAPAARVPLPPEPSAGSIPLVPTRPPGVGLEEGAITMEQTLVDGGDVGWLLIAAIGLGLVLIVVFSHRRAPPDPDSPR